MIVDMWIKKIFISSKRGTNLGGDLLEMIEENLPQKYQKVDLMIPYDRQNLVNYFLDNYEVDYIEYLIEGTRLNLSINQVDFERYSDYILC